MSEQAFFLTGASELPAILHAPASPCSTGVLIIVGGPQYRVGSHRQFVLLARALAAAGYPVLRFDYGGMGDATGPVLDFEHAGPDIRRAVDAFFQRQPDLRQIVIWGLCDAASAALFYAHTDPRISGLALANPWVRTPTSEAQAYLKHYYWRRLKSPDFWKKLLGGGLRPGDSLRAMLGFWKQSRPATSNGQEALTGTLPERMAQGWTRFPGPILLLLSGDDLTAREFLDTAAKHPAWTGKLTEARLQREDFPDANHTFSRGQWRDQLAKATLAWLERLG